MRLLYHTKNDQGTITRSEHTKRQAVLYHTKNDQGTITKWVRLFDSFKIIPYQERSGNYNGAAGSPVARGIIPYQERSGNYNRSDGDLDIGEIIPYQERSGNYNTGISCL